MFYEALNSTNEEQQRMVGYVLGDILFGYMLSAGAGKVADVAGDFSKGAKAAIEVTTDGKIVLKGQYADDAAKYLDDLADVGKYADDIIYKFKSNNELISHYIKHSEQIKSVFGYNVYDMNQYLDDANYIIHNGMFAKEKNAYVKHLLGDKFGFVGIDNYGNITTFHIKTLEWLRKNAPSLGL